jgi:hypothetical protein
VKSIWLKKLVNALIGPPDSNGCRKWLGWINSKGYRVWKYEGKRYVAHKLILCIEQNIPYVDQKDMIVKMDAAHNCPNGDNPWCCTPKHLSWMDSKQHGEDRKAKEQMATGDKHGTHTHPEKVARGEKSSGHRLTEQKVRMIRKLYATGNWTLVTLAKKYHVSHEAIRLIVNGITWKHLVA